MKKISRAIEMENLHAIVSWAKEELKVILEDLPRLKKNAYLVYSSPYGQCNLTADRFEIFQNFPKFFISCENHAQIAININQSREKTEPILQLLQPQKGIEIEFRFADLDFTLIEALKHHPRTRQPAHMMSSAWIRVILCSLENASLLIKK